MKKTSLPQPAPSTPEHPQPQPPSPTPVPEQPQPRWLSSQEHSVLDEDINDRKPIDFVGEYVADDDSTAVPPAPDSAERFSYRGHFERPRTSETRGNKFGNPDTVSKDDEVDDADHGIPRDAPVDSGRNENPIAVSSDAELLPDDDDDDVEMADAAQNVAPANFGRDFSVPHDFDIRFLIYALDAADGSLEQHQQNAANHVLSMVEEDVAAAFDPANVLLDEIPMDQNNPFENQNEEVSAQNDPANALLDESEYQEDQNMVDQENQDPFDNQNKEAAVENALRSGSYYFQSMANFTPLTTFPLEIFDGYFIGRIDTTGFNNIPILIWNNEYDEFRFILDPILDVNPAGELPYFVSGLISFPGPIDVETFDCWPQENYLYFRARKL